MPAPIEAMKGQLAEFAAENGQKIAKGTRYVNAKKTAGKATWGIWDDLPKVVWKGRKYATINGRLYTREAIDRMTPKAFGTAAGGY